MAVEKVWIFGALLFGVLLWLNFHSRRPALRVLMYHKIDPSRTDFLTVTTTQLHQHLTYLQQAGYQFVALTDLLQALADPTVTLPPRAVLITFDDAYENNLTFALPILHELSVPATIFVPTAYIGKTNEWDGSTDTLLTAEQLNGLTNTGVTLAYHTHRHINLKHTPVADIRIDLETSFAEATRLNLTVLPALAYPYGGRPEDPATKQLMVATLEQLGIRVAFRIGNRFNALPLQNRYELNRIDVRGTYSLSAFRRKVRWGKLL